MAKILFSVFINFKAIIVLFNSNHVWFEFDIQSTILFCINQYFKILIILNFTFQYTGNYLYLGCGGYSGTFHDDSGAWSYVHASYRYYYLFNSHFNDHWHSQSLYIVTTVYVLQSFLIKILFRISFL